MAKDLKYIKKYCINFVDKVNGLIDISKINSGDITINEDEYETKNFIDEIEKLINKKLVIKRGKLPSVLSNDKEKNISEYLGKGYVDYIIKPLNKRNINEVLKKHLK